MNQSRPIRALLLAAGFGTRLRPLTDHWPKCLMPIGTRPLLDYWLDALYQAHVHQVLINLHYHHLAVIKFLKQSRFTNWVDSIYEPTLLGTAGTLRENHAFFKESVTLCIHADNWSLCDLAAFIEYHCHRRPPSCAMTMMTFDTDTPETCGIVELDRNGIVQGWHEKVAQPPGTQANAAVYMLEPEVLDWLIAHPAVTDFSTQVIPAWLGRIATWHHQGVHRDIGTVSSLLQAQQDPKPLPVWAEIDPWQHWFCSHKIHQQIVTIAHQCYR
jgi:mannose-1-phosphate guanylyltransferase